MRRVVARLLPWLPHRLRRAVARRLLGWELHPTAYVGRSVIDVRTVRLGEGAVIGHRNLIRGLDELSMGRGASMGSGNQITGYPDRPGIFVGDPPRRSALLMADYSGITTNHTIDCSDVVELEHHALLVGFNTVVLTHSLDLRTNLFRVQPVRVRAHAVVMSGCTVFVGTEIAAGSVVSAGSVVARSLDAEHTLYRGNPAVAERELDPSSYALLSRPGQFGVG